MFLSHLFSDKYPLNILFDYSAVKEAFVFQRRVDAYGKLYGYLPSVAKWFPKASDYQPAREASMKLFGTFKVIHFNSLLSLPIISMVGIFSPESC